MTDEREVPLVPQEGEPLQEKRPYPKKTREEKRFAKETKLQRLRDRDGNICYLCEKDLDDVGTLEHIIPRSRGGSSKLENLALAHSRCNAKKGDKLPEELSLPFTWDDDKIGETFSGSSYS